MPILVFTGRLGAGKTLGMSAYAYKLRASWPLAKLYANYGLKGAIRIKSFADLLAAERGIICLDEGHITLDSRNFKDKSSQKVTHWLLQTRKMHLIVLMTTQQVHQIDKRARDVMDTEIMCSKMNDGRIKMAFRDTFDGRIGRVEFIQHPEYVYKLYDTNERIDPID